jgi:hypothetical protein
MGGKLVFFGAVVIAVAALLGMGALLVVDVKPPTRTIEKVVPDARLSR